MAALGEWSKIDSPPEGCIGCVHSEYNSNRGLFGAWECHHTDNPFWWPPLDVLVAEPGQPVRCRLGGPFIKRR